MEKLGKTYISPEGKKVEFDGVPEGAYCLSGIRGDKPGQLMKMVYTTRGSCLFPVIEAATGQRICFPEHAGKVYTKGCWIEE